MEAFHIAIVSSHHPAAEDLGLPRVVSKLSSFLASWGHHVEVYYPRPSGSKGRDAPVWQGVKAHGVEVDGMGWFPFGPDLVFSRAVARQLDPKLDVVMANNERGGAPVVLRAKRDQRRGDGVHPLVLEVIHGLSLRVLQLGRRTRRPGLRSSVGFHLDDWALRRLEGRAARYADVCVVPSRTVREDMIRTYRVEPRRAVVIYNGVDPRPQRTEEDVRNARRALGLDPETHYLTFVGHDADRKGLDIAVGTVQRLRRGGLRAELLNVGNDVPSTEGMRSFRWVDDATKGMALDAADVFLFPTHYDTLPLAVLEAAARGIPVVTTEGANVEMGEPGKDFVLVHPNDVPSHTKVLEELLHDRDRLAALGRSGRAALGTRSYETQAREYLELFHAGLNGVGADRPRASP